MISEESDFEDAAHNPQREGPDTTHTLVGQNGSEFWAHSEMFLALNDLVDMRCMRHMCTVGQDTQITNVRLWVQNMCVCKSRCLVPLRLKSQHVCERWSAKESTNVSTCVWQPFHVEFS